MDLKALILNLFESNFEMRRAVEYIFIVYPSGVLPAELREKR